MIQKLKTKKKKNKIERWGNIEALEMRFDAPIMGSVTEYIFSCRHKVRLRAANTKTPNPDFNETLQPSKAMGQTNRPYHGPHEEIFDGR